MNKMMGSVCATIAAVVAWGMGSSSAWAAGEEYLVKLKPSARADEITLLSQAGLEVMQRFDEIDVIHVRVVEQRRFRMNGPVLASRAEYVAKNGTVHIVDDGSGSSETTPSDPYWKKDQRRYRELDLEKAWEITTGSKSVIVSVSDTGLSQKHPDLMNGLWTNPRPDESRDGIRGDLHGWNFLKNSPDMEDDHGHGSHVAGIIGGEANNGKGIAGVNWRATIIGTKFLSAAGSGTDAGGIATILYSVNRGARLINCSWGGGDYNPAMLDAINYAYSKGALVIAAAGNSQESTDSKPHYPSAYRSPGIVSVAATGSPGFMAWFSNIGQASVHLAAPGQDILSAYMGKGYRTWSGTSMATPMVTGVAALILAVRPELSAKDLRNALFNAAVFHQRHDGYLATAGEINANRALRQFDEGFQVWPKRFTVRQLGEHSFTAWGAKGEVTWTVSPEGAATIGSDGTLQATLIEGDLVVTATDAAGNSGLSQVRVVTDYQLATGCSPADSSAAHRKRGGGTDWARVLNFGLPFMVGMLAIAGARRRRRPQGI